jgi:4-azaleucine resistance transporter AzlC
VRQLREDLPALTRATTPSPDAGDARRRLLVDAVGVSVSAGAFAVVYGLAARTAGFSVIEAFAMSTIVLAGASQFAAVGLVAAGVPWAAIVLLTALLNVRHALYAAVLAPWTRGRSIVERAAMAHVLTDETFALALPHFRRLSAFDAAGYWLAAGAVVIPWVAGTLVGYAGGQVIPDPRVLGLDVVFPAAMAGLAVGLIDGRRDLVAAMAGAVVAVAVALVSDPAVGIVAGGLLGPAAAFALPSRAR